MANMKRLWKKWKSGKPVWHVIFIGAFSIQFVVILLTFGDYGVTWDEPHSHFYGVESFRWYKSGFSNMQTIIAYGDIAFYGALPEFIPGMVHDLFGADSIFVFRKLYTALFSLLGLIGVYRLTHLISDSYRSACFAAILLMLNPVIYGHSFLNAKDMFFSVMHIWSIFYLVRCLNDAPHWKLIDILMLGVFTGLTMGVRVGGLVLVAYLLGAGLIIGLISARKQGLAWQVFLKQYAKLAFIAFFVSYFVMLIFWPWAQLDPLTRPFEAFMHFANKPWPGTVFFQGEYHEPEDLPFYYLPMVMLYQLTEITIAGLAVFIICFVSRLKSMDKSRAWLQAMVVGMAIFPVFYIMISGAIVFDNFRHVIFVVPMLCALAGMGLDDVIDAFQKVSANTKLRLALYLTLLLLFLHPVLMIVRLHPYQYAYYNIFAGGPRHAYKYYESDYWVHAMDETMGMLDEKIKRDWGEQGIAYKVTSNPVSIGAIATSYSDILKSIPEKEREQADFAVATTRWGLHEYFDGVTIIENKLFGHTICVVKDCRPYRLFKKISLNAQLLKVAEKRISYFDKRIETPERFVGRLMVSEPEIGQKHQLSFVPRYNTVVSAYTEDELVAEAMISAGWIRQTHTAIPQMSMHFKRTVAAGRTFESNLPALYLMWPE